MEFAVFSKKSGVADFGYDLYFLVIAELLNHKYLGLLNFYFHTLIQQRQKSNTELINVYYKYYQYVRDNPNGEIISSLDSGTKVAIGVNDSSEGEKWARIIAPIEGYV